MSGADLVFNREERKAREERPVLPRSARRTIRCHAFAILATVAVKEIAQKDADASQLFFFRPFFGSMFR